MNRGHLIAVTLDCKHSKIFFARKVEGLSSSTLVQTSYNVTLATLWHMEKKLLKAGFICQGYDKETDTGTYLRMTTLWDRAYEEIKYRLYLKSLDELLEILRAL